MSYEVKFKAGDIEFSAKAVSFGFSRNYDPHTGVPLTETIMQDITVTADGTKDTKLADWATNPEMHKDGTITYFSSKDNSKMMELEFKEGYLSSFQESFGNGKPLTVCFSIMAKSVSVGNAQFVNEWK
ncbi:MAG: hypothetical protein KBF25_03115 [Chitinophagaceae bacterium]|jgi:hypothetical protein|nr:hypothetical protein [Bacteroidota bacterium]MBP9932656.1 hypothetical protein [Chitinophagaceae bacterium]